MINHIIQEVYQREIWNVVVTQAIARKGAVGVPTFTAPTASRFQVQMAIIVGQFHICMMHIVPSQINEKLLYYCDIV